MDTENTENTKKTKKMSLLTRINLVSILPNVLGAFVFFFYSVFAIQSPVNEWLPSLKYIIPIILLLEFIGSPIMVYIVLGNTSHMLDDFYEGKLNENERLLLFKKASHISQNYAFLVLGFFCFGSVLFYLIFRFICNMKALTAIFSLFECLYCSALVSAISFTYVRALTTGDLRAIFKSGLPKDKVLKQKTFGQTLFSQTLIFVIIPTVMTAILAIYVVFIGYYPLNLPSQWTYEWTQINRMICMCILNFAAQFVLVLVMTGQIVKSNKTMTETLEDLEDDLNSDKIIETDVHDEIAYNQYLSNLMIGYLRNILKETHNIGTYTDNSANGLLKVAGETESTAIEQSTATNEIVATMEEANNLSKSIETKISEVSDIAVQTADDVSELYSILEKNLQKMAQIQTANEETIQAIKDVNEKKSSIWEIINLINSIADTTKIIAFNAELEATNVHEKGRNFKNVANEIRRLANSTMDSTKEIKDRINDIEAATEKLSSLSANSTSKINDGMTLAHSLEKSFTSINSSATESAESSAEIKVKIDQETEAFKQILVTLQQVSKSIDNFSSSTHLVLDSATDLQVSVRELNEINEDSVIEECHHCHDDEHEEMVTEEDTTAEAENE